MTVSEYSEFDFMLTFTSMLYIFMWVISVLSFQPEELISAFANEGLRMGAETEEEGRDFLFAQYSGSVTLAMVHHPSDDSGSSF